MKQYPLMLDLADRLTVVVGGGPVAVRKAASLLQAGARVRMICPDPSKADLAGDNGDPSTQTRLSRVAEPYRSEHIENATLVFAAATPEVNARVVIDAQARRIWVNSADDPESGDFSTPAIVRRGELVIAVGTGGAAPAAARNICEMLDGQFDNAWAIWLDIQGELRPAVLNALINREKRRIVFDRLADLAWLPRIRSQGGDAVRAAMRQVLEEGIG